jgi:hypothetical protein
MKTPEQIIQRKISVAYLASGNSVDALCTQLIEALHPGKTMEEAVEEFYKDIEKSLYVAREEEPMETSVEQELDTLVKIYGEHEYEVNSAAWG